MKAVCANLPDHRVDSMLWRPRLDTKAFPSSSSCVYPVQRSSKNWIRLRPTSNCCTRYGVNRTFLLYQNLSEINNPFFHKYFERFISESLKYLTVTQNKHKNGRGGFCPPNQSPSGAPLAAHHTILKGSLAKLTGENEQTLIFIFQKINPSNLSNHTTE